MRRTLLPICAFALHRAACGQTTPDTIESLRDLVETRVPFAAGAGLSTSRTAVFDANGFLTPVLGAESDCIRVDGTSQPCAPAFFDAEVPQGAVDGVNVTFTLMAAPTPTSSLVLHRNGLLQHIPEDFTLAGSSITFASGAIPQAGDILVASYRSDASAGAGKSLARKQLGPVAKALNNVLIEMAREIESPRNEQVEERGRGSLNKALPPPDANVSDHIAARGRLREAPPLRSEPFRVFRPERSDSLNDPAIRATTEESTSTKRLEPQLEPFKSAPLAPQANVPLENRKNVRRDAFNSRSLRMVRERLGDPGLFEPPATESLVNTPRGDGTLCTPSNHSSIQLLQKELGCK